MNKKFKLATAVTLITLGLSGCGGVNDKTPEAAYQSLQNAEAEHNVDTVMGMISSDYAKKMGISDMNLVKEEFSKKLNDLKASEYKLVNVNVTGVDKISDTVSVVHADTRFKTNASQDVKTTSDDTAVFVNEDGHWKYSLLNYIDTFQYQNKCGTNGPIEICVNKINYFSNQLAVDVSITNKSNDQYKLGFASESGLALHTTSGQTFQGTTSGEINPGKQTGKLILSSGIIGKNDFDAFQIDSIIKMSGGLPSGFDSGLTVQVKLK